MLQAIRRGEKEANVVEENTVEEENKFSIRSERFSDQEEFDIET